MAPEASRLAIDERRLRRAVADGDVATVRTELAKLLLCAQNASSSQMVASCLVTIAHAAPLVVSSSPQDGRTLADSVLRIAEPWFDAEIDGFIDVAQDARHVALHALMHACAQQGDFGAALVVRRAEEDCNERCHWRWVRLAIRSSPGTHAHYPTAYGTGQLVAVMAASDTFSDVPALLDTLEALTSRFATDDDPECRDAYASEEVAALRALISARAPADLKTRCLTRCDALRELASPPDAWPRTREALAAASPLQP